MTPSQTYAAALVAVTGAMLGGALFIEHVMNLTPCPLCLMQRIWVMIVGAIALAGLAHNPRILIYPLLSFLAAMIGAGFSIRQLYLQNLPPDQVPSCGAPLEYLLDGPLGDLLREMSLGGGNCAEVSFSLIGISIPGWVLLGFMALAGLAALQFLAARR
jgi:disulfide bond formation protein DsbB